MLSIGDTTIPPAREQAVILVKLPGYDPGAREARESGQWAYCMLCFRSYSKNWMPRNLFDCIRGPIS